ncbi:hypothetical protein [Williamwhitmania taraxaci]|uniref:Uncharacterized protein n=1 Tax=Williamwhitmania taraxaci TaxID=1640674 RepID=A0A1G6GL48_9BACT|nr:hypothetical protein [Williamwhitmania taraxaci]SDB82639.1 hypothetical protein SAMN05216323_100214 [Williamwhitmania taraxaci]
MNETGDVVVTRLREKLSTLLDAFEQLQASNNEFLQEKEQLTEQLRKKDEIIEQLERKTETLMVAKTFASGSDDAHDAKLKINRIVREIDKCIALLNR